VVTAKKSWGPGDFAGIEEIFNFFRAAGYAVGASHAASKESPFEDTGEQLAESIQAIYKVVDELDLNFHVWVIVGTGAIHIKTWRRTINEEIARGGGSHVIFYTTETFSDYHLAMISKRRTIEVGFRPANPGLSAQFLLTRLLDPSLIVTRSPTGICDDLNDYSQRVTASIFSAFFFILAGCGTILVFTLLYYSSSSNMQSYQDTKIMFYSSIIMGSFLLVLGIVSLGMILKRGGK
jgi:hypothetical protein